MKKSTTLIPLSFSLFLGAQASLASDSSEFLENDGVHASRHLHQSTMSINTPLNKGIMPTLLAEAEFDPRDLNHDGKITLGERIHYFFDQDKDGDIDFDDLKLALHKLWIKVKTIFDVDGDGKIEFDEIILVTQTSLEKLDTLAGRILSLSGNIQGSSYFALIPEEVRGALQGLFTIVDEAAEKTQEGVNIGGFYVTQIDAALKDLKPQIMDLLKGDASPEEMMGAKKDLFAYLEMVKGWYNTGDNIKLVTSIEKKMAKAKA